MKPTSQACMTKQRQPGYWAPDTRILPTGKRDFHQRWVQDTSSQACRSDVDPRRVGPCMGCTQPQDLQWLKEKGFVK